MPFDKVVDSAQLNSALTAEANAIRAKTGESAKIPWNATTGFASAISAIEGGKIAEGEFATGTVGGFIWQNPIAVSGLNFKPSRVIFYTKEAWSNCSGVVMCDSSGYCVGYWYESYSDGDEEYQDIYGGAMYSSPTVTFTSNGFEVSATEEGEYCELVWHSSKYHYIALG